MNDLEVIDATAQEVSTPIADDTLIGLAEQAEKRIDAMNKIKRVAIKLTNKHDWVDQSGRPYLQVSGAEKIARMFGISWRISEPVFETAEGGHFSYTYRGDFSLAGASIQAIGTRSSKDGFFKKYSYEKQENGEKDKKVELPPSEIDKGDLKKAAYTNCIGNGITRLLGIRNLTYDDLQEFAGLTQDTLGKVEYKKKGRSDTGIASEGAKSVTVAVTDVRKKVGKTKAGKDYTVYTIKNGNAEYSTFSETIAKTAKEAIDAGRQVVISYITDNFGNKIESLVFADNGPGAGESRDPGQEG
jgi:hypothetical protein